MQTTTKAPAPSIRLGVGSGDPAGFPGYRPLNPWGRPMPKSKPKPPPPDRQVFVTTRDNRIIPIGPKVSDDAILQPLVRRIEEAIAAGLERDWRDPHIVKLLTQRAPGGLIL